jgi:tetratricopeptide (TPR) repeat protein
MKPAFVILAATLVLAGCQTNLPPPVKGDPSEIYFQRAQAASDLYEYSRAMSYYQEFLDNEPSQTHEETFAARYEIAIILIKTGKIAEAEKAFEGIVADFNNLDKSSDVPSWIRILSQRKLQELQDKLAKVKVQEKT